MKQEHHDKMEWTREASLDAQSLLCLVDPIANETVCEPDFTGLHAMVTTA